MHLSSLALIRGNWNLDWCSQADCSNPTNLEALGPGSTSESPNDHNLAALQPRTGVVITTVVAGGRDCTP